MTTTAAPVAIDNGIPLLDPHPPRLGPISRRLLLRLVVVLAVVEIAGAILTFGVATTRARAVGLSLTLPGGGFLYTARPVEFLITAVLVLVALVLWWGLSTHFAIPLVWAGSALVAGLLAGAPRLFVDEDTTWGWAIPVVYALAIAVIGTAIWKFERRFRRKRAKVAELNEYLVDGAPARARPAAARAERDGRRAAALLLRPRPPARRRPQGPGLGRAVPRRDAAALPAQRVLLGAQPVCGELRAQRAGAGRSGTGRAGGQAHRPAGVEVLAHAQPARQLRHQPGPDRARQHHVLGVLRRRAQRVRGGHRVHPLRRARLADVRVEGRAHVPVRPPLDRRGGGGQLRPQPARLLPVRTGLVVHGVQHHGRPGDARPRRAPRHRHVGPPPGPLADHAGAGVPHARRDVRAHPLQPRRPVVGHRRGARRALQRQRDGPLRRHPPGARQAGQGARPARRRRRGWPSCRRSSPTGTLPMEMPPELERHRTRSSLAARLEQGDRRGSPRRRRDAWPRRRSTAPPASAPPAGGGRSGRSPPGRRP